MSRKTIFLMVKDIKLIKMNKVEIITNSLPYNEVTAVAIT